MKIIHCADLHLDSRIDSLPSDKGKIRREEVLRSFERLTDYAAQNGVTAIIIAGDMFDTARVTVKTKSRVLSAVKRNPSVDFLYLTGNHDEADAFEGETLPDNFKRFCERKTSFRYGNVVITGVSSAGNGFDLFYGGLDLNENDVNIVALHGQIAGYAAQEKAEVISLPQLREKNIDYLALGHIHAYKEDKLDNRGTYAYSGCLDGRGFDETGKKGFVLLEETNGKLTREFIPFSSREFCEKEFSVTGEEDWFDFKERVIYELKKEFSSDSLVKVILSGAHKTQFEADAESLSVRLNEEFFFAKVYDKTTLEITDEDYQNDKSVRGEFVRAVWESDLPQDKKSAIITLGLNALKGENVV